MNYFSILKDRGYLKKLFEKMDLIESEDLRLAVADLFQAIENEDW